MCALMCTYTCTSINAINAPMNAISAIKAPMNEIDEVNAINSINAIICINVFLSVEIGLLVTSVAPRISPWLSRAPHSAPRCSSWLFVGTEVGGIQLGGHLLGMLWQVET